MISLKNPPGVRTLTTEESGRLHQQYPDLPSPERCVTCRGKKKFTWWDGPWPDRQMVEYECDCIEQWVLHRYLLHCGVKLAYQQLTWSDMEWVENKHIVAIDNYLDRHDRYVANGFGMILYGSDKGTGKTGLASLMAKRLVAEGHDVFFTTFASMLSMFMGTFRDNDETAWFHRRIRNAGVLVIDDLGREHSRRNIPSASERDSGATTTRSTTALAESTLEEVVRHRVASLRPTIITTNLDIGGVEQRYGGHLISLLRERSQTCSFVGKDRRDQVRNRMHDEVESGLTRPIVIG